MNRFNRFLNERRILDFVEHLTTLDGDELDTVLESIDSHSLQLIEQMLAETNLRRLGRQEKSLRKGLKRVEGIAKRAPVPEGLAAIIKQELERTQQRRKEALEDGKFRTYMRPKIDTSNLDLMPADQRNSQAQAMIANVRDQAGPDWRERNAVRDPNPEYKTLQNKYFRRRGM
jgi:hypothetical protein